MVVRNGSLQLFKLFGITVWLHWSWLIVAYFMVQRNRDYTTPVWAVLEYLALFAIVLTHEFGHALACRSVGGKADTIMLWPLGGIAFVSPPLRPGATLWSIFAGPLVNIVLVPVTWVLATVVGTAYPETNVATFTYILAIINTALLIFNMLPVYPLDGGQILQSLLWFVLGYVRSLRVASVLGMIGAGGLIVLAIMLNRGPLTYVIIVFLGMEALKGYRMAQFLSANPSHVEAITGPRSEQAPPQKPSPAQTSDSQYRPPQF